MEEFIRAVDKAIRYIWDARYVAEHNENVEEYLIEVSDNYDGYIDDKLIIDYIIKKLSDM